MAVVLTLRRHQKDILLLSRCADWSTSNRSLRVRGTLWEDNGGRWKLVPAEIYAWGSWEFFGWEVELPEFSGRPESGQRVWISARAACRFPLQNPGVNEDGLGRLLLPRVRLRQPIHFLPEPSAPQDWLRTARNRFKSWLLKFFDGFPGVSGFVIAIWTGDTRGLSPQLMKFYREGGLLPILALSGQHLAGLIFLVSYVERLPFVFLRKRNPVLANRLLGPTRRLVFFLCAFLLWVTSGGAPAMLRTVAMALALGLLKWRAMHCASFQILTSSTALLLLWDVRQAASVGLFLSVAATALTLVVFCEARLSRRFAKYFFASLWIPVLMLPVTCFFFGRISLLAPFYQTLLGWIWDLFLIPFGFALPFVVMAIPIESARTFLLWALERSWNIWLWLHELLQQTVGNVNLVSVRPKWLELFLIESLLIGLLLYSVRWIQEKRL